MADRQVVTVQEVVVSNAAVDVIVPMEGTHFIQYKSFKTRSSGADVTPVSGDDLDIKLSMGGAGKFTNADNFTTATTLELDTAGGKHPLAINTKTPVDRIHITPSQVQATEDVTLVVVSKMPIVA